MKYTTYGNIRDGCGHRHETFEAAEDCLYRDRDGCRSQNGYSDRKVVVIGDDGLLYYDEGCTEWVPGAGGRTSGAARF